MNMKIDTFEIKGIINKSIYCGYNRIPDDVRKYLNHSNITDQEASEVMRKLLGIYLSDFFERLEKKKVPISVKELFENEYLRIKKELGTNPLGYYSLENDLYLKDFGITRQKLIPVGAELVDENSGIPRSIIFKSGISGFLKGVLYFIFKTRGFRPFYQLHLDIRNLSEFSPEGWIKTYIRLSELLELNPHVKGFFGASWFYDPALKKFSPHLAYMRETRESAGAKTFYWGEEDSVLEMALKTSKTRRRFYESGEYRPSSYFIVWERQNLIDWVNSREGTNARGPGI